MGDAVITMECLICGDSVKTGRVEAALAFDREHTALHAAQPAPSGAAEGGTR